MGSSSSNTFAALHTSPASASLVFSPPESVPAGWATVSPLNRKAPRMRRSSTSEVPGAAARMLSNTDWSVSRVSCSWA